MRRSAAALGGLILCLAIGGCVEQSLTFDSTPQGALITANSQELGRTPVSRDFTFYGNYDVQVRLDGYETLQVSQPIKAPWWNFPPLDLIASLLPLQLRDHHHYSYNLTPASTQPLDAKSLEARADRFRGLLESSPNTRPPTTRPSTTQAATRPHSK